MDQVRTQLLCVLLSGLSCSLQLQVRNRRCCTGAVLVPGPLADDDAVIRPSYLKLALCGVLGPRSHATLL
jgi:hypothetical protein